MFKLLDQSLKNQLISSVQPTNVTDKIRPKDKVYKWLLEFSSSSFSIPTDDANFDKQVL